ncbi:ankyrin repeat domain-containing protein, partial [Dethiosulfovibrio salsuginis]
MSLLDVMKKRQEQMSKAPHPLKDDERGARFAYLVGMAMVATVDGSIDPEEENILLNRAIAMNLPEDDGIRAIEAAKTADSETISSVLESLSERRQRVIFMIDLRIMAHADGSLKSEECELWNLFGDMMEINQDDRKALSTFADASLEPDEERASEAIAGIIKHDLDIPISAIKFFLPSTKNISVDNDFFVFLVEKNNLKHIKLALALEAKNNNEIASNVTRANTHGYGETLLHYAARFNTNPEFIKTLIDAGADIKAKTEDEYTPLHFAAALNSNPEIIATLIEAGADIEAKTRYKETPLHVAAELNKNPEIVATLIKAGADIEAKDT